MTTPRGTDAGAQAENDPQELRGTPDDRPPGPSSAADPSPSAGRPSGPQPSATQPPAPGSAPPVPPGPVGTGDRAVRTEGLGAQATRQPGAPGEGAGGRNPATLEPPRPGWGERPGERGSAGTSPTTVLPAVDTSPRVSPPSPVAGPTPPTPVAGPTPPVGPTPPRRLTQSATAPPRVVPRGEGRSSPASRPAGAARPRRARLTLKRIDPWSVFLLSLVGSVFLGIAAVVAAAVLYSVVGSLGVTASLNDLFAEVTGTSAGTEPLLTAGRVIGTAAVLAAVNVVLLTLLATLGAVLYNLCASFTGGLELTFGERD